MSQNPFSTPQTTSKIASTKRHHFIPTNKLTKVIIVAMALLILFQLLVAILSTVGSLMYPSFMNFNADVSSSGEQSLLLTISGIGFLSLPLYLMLAITICMFMYRCNANLRSVNAQGLINSPGWCGGWWFVPIMNLFKPYYCMKEIYLASKKPYENINRLKATGVGILSTWWACWIISNIASRLETRLALQGIDIGAMAVPLVWLSCLLSIVAGVTLINIVSQVDKWQTDLPGKATHSGI